MRIAVFGSSETETSEGISPIWSKDSVEGFCRQFGSRLAVSLDTLLVESDRSRTADWLVVGGLLDDGPPSKDQIVVYSRDPTDRPFEAESARSPDFFRFIDTKDALLGPAHLSMLRDADVALVVGGGKHAYQAGLMAAGMGKRVLPIPAFGGAARDLYLELEFEFKIDRPSMRLPKKRHWERLNAPTPSGAVDAAFEEIDNLPRLMVVHGRSPDREQLKIILDELGSDSVVVADSFDAGQVIPQAFMRDAAGVDGAIVLLTPDDQVAAARDSSGELMAPGEPKWRARQNVILEIGWFWGRLGLDRTLLLFKEEIEEPSDLHGVFHASYRDGPEQCKGDIHAFIDAIHHGGRS